MTIYFNTLTYDSFFSIAYHGRKPLKYDFLKERIKPRPCLTQSETRLEKCKRYLWTSLPLLTLNHELGLAISTCSEIIVAAQSASKVFHSQKLKTSAYAAFCGLLALSTTAAHFFDRSLSPSPLGRRISWAIKLTALMHELVISTEKIRALKIDEKSKIIKLCTHIASTILCMLAVIFQSLPTTNWFLHLQFATEICFTGRQIYKGKYFAASISFSTSFLRYIQSSRECLDILIDPSEIDKEMEYSKYEDSVADFGEEYLYFKRNGPREKFLILCAEVDYGTRALDPKHIKSIILRLSEKFDVKFRTICKVEDIQKEIQVASQMGRVMGILLQAHGNPSSMHLSNDPSARLGLEDISPTLFSGLDPNCVIALDSCSTAKYPDISLAFKIANQSQRTTFAADDACDFLILEKVWPLEWSFQNTEKTVGTKKIVPEYSVV